MRSWPVGRRDSDAQCGQVKIADSFEGCHQGTGRCAESVGKRPKPPGRTAEGIYLVAAEEVGKVARCLNKLSMDRDAETRGYWSSN